MAWSGGSKQSGQRFTLLHPPAQSCTAPFVPAEALLRPFHIGVYLPASTQLVVSSLMQPKALHVLRRIAQKQADFMGKAAAGQPELKCVQHLFQPSVHRIALPSQQ